jgi:pentapeptide MXKDX repeat protein
MTKSILLSAFIAAGLAMAPLAATAYAADTNMNMKKSDSMSNDNMKKDDGMTKKSSMSGDNMKKDDGMNKGAMSGDNMSNGTMKK